MLCQDPHVEKWSSVNVSIFGLEINSISISMVDKKNLVSDGINFVAHYNLVWVGVVRSNFEMGLLSNALRYWGCILLYHANLLLI